MTEKSTWSTEDEIEFINALPEDALANYIHVTSKRTNKDIDLPICIKTARNRLIEALKHGKLSQE